MKKCFFLVFLLVNMLFSMFVATVNAVTEEQVCPCDSLDDWTGGSCTLALDTDDKQEGSASIKATVTVATTASGVYNPAGTWDWSDSTYLKLWIKVSVAKNVRVRVTDAVGGYEYWTYAQSVNWEEKTFVFGTGTGGGVDLTQIERITIYYYATAIDQTFSFDDIRRDIELEEEGEYSYTFTETLKPSATLNQWQEQYILHMETTYPSATLSYAQEIIRTYTETVTTTETTTYSQEQIYTLAETLALTVTFEYSMEGVQVFVETFTETLTPTATLFYWMELAEVFITNIETLTPQAFLYYSIQELIEEITIEFALATLAIILALVALALVVTKKG